MAKLTAPLFSMSASGSIASLITFTSHGNRSVAKKWATPPKPTMNTLTAAQQAYIDTMNNWKVYDPVTRASELAARDYYLNQLLLEYPDTYHALLNRNVDRTLSGWEVWVSYWLKVHGA